MNIHVELSVAPYFDWQAFLPRVLPRHAGGVGGPHQGALSRQTVRLHRGQKGQTDQLENSYSQFPADGQYDQGMSLCSVWIKVCGCVQYGLRYVTVRYGLRYVTVQYGLRLCDCVHDQGQVYWG